MYHVIFCRPKNRVFDKVDALITTFECDTEEQLRAIFDKHYLGSDFITSSAHPTRELAYKQVYSLGDDVLYRHNAFHIPAMMCAECGINGFIDEHTKLCVFCGEAFKNQ